MTPIMTNALEVGGECWTGNFIPIYCPAPSYWQRINQREETGTSESAAPTRAACPERFYADLLFSPSGAF